MALADIEAELAGEVPWRTCAVCHWLSVKDTDWCARMRRMLANRGIKFADIADRLAADPTEPTIDRDALSRHARGICSAREALRKMPAPPPGTRRVGDSCEPC